MFGLSKRERYESKVEIFLMAMFGAGKHGAMLAKGLKDRYSDHWDAVIEEGLELGNSPELTGAALSSIFYRDMISNEFSADQIMAIRETILAQDHSEDSGFPSRLIYSALVMSVAYDKNMPRDFQALWFRDIHRAIFGEDDTHLDSTITYLLDAAKNLREVYKDVNANA